MLAALVIKDGRLRPALRVVVFALAAMSLLFVLRSQLEAMLPLGGGMPMLVIAAGEVVGAVLVVALAALLRRHLDQRSVASLGVSPAHGSFRLFAIGVAFGAGMQSVVFLSESLTGAARIASYGTLAGDGALVLLAGLGFLATAMLEEVIFRGYALQNLWEEWGFAPALIITSMAFTLLHFDNPHARDVPLATFAGLLSFAVWACFSLYWTKSLWLAVGAHAAWNLFEGPIFGFPVSGLSMGVPTVLGVRVEGPAWLTGGSFGPEAGASSLIALALGSIVLFALQRRGAFRASPDPREAYARR